MSFARSLTRGCKWVKVLNYASGTADRTTAVVDTNGYGGLAFVVDLAAVAANAVTNIYIAHADAASDTNTLTSGANVATTSQTIDDTDDNQVFIVDCQRPTKRYYQLTVNKDGSNACAETVTAILYNAKSQPVTHGGGNTSVVGDGHAAVNYELVGTAASGTI